jgi:hypothetical protein
MDPKPEPDPYLVLMDPGGTKICVSGPGSATLVQTQKDLVLLRTYL